MANSRITTWVAAAESCRLGSDDAAEHEVAKAAVILGEGAGVPAEAVAAKGMGGDGQGQRHRVPDALVPDVEAPAVADRRRHRAEDVAVHRPSQERCHLARHRGAQQRRLPDQSSGPDDGLSQFSRRRPVYDLLYPVWKRHPARGLKQRRLKLVDRHLGGVLLAGDAGRKLRILEVGCNTGADFLQFFKGSPHEFFGIDIEDFSREVPPNFTFLHQDAERIPFPDKFFDVTVTFGVLEHIEPIEKLCRVVSEIERVSKGYAMIAPCIATPLEPHMVSFFWQIRSRRKRATTMPNYFSDEAWLKFEGFRGARVRRFWYLPPLIRNLCIYKADGGALSAPGGVQQGKGGDGRRLGAQDPGAQ